jgi:hypothetical protein
MTEVIRRESEYDESSVLVLFVKPFERLILGRECAFARRVDNQNHLARIVIAQVHGLAADQFIHVVIQQLAATDL